MQITQPTRRDKLFIIAEILEIALSGAQKTQIMYRANLGYAQVNDYLNFMVRINLLTRASESNKEIFKSAEKGIDFLQRYREVSATLFGYELSRPKHENNLPRIRTELKKLKDAIAQLEIDLLNTMTCPTCQEEVFHDYKFCPNCGAKLKIETGSEVTK